MSQGGDTADLMVKEGIEIAEAAVKLTALGMKNLAALVLAMAKDEHKLSGLTNISRMLKDGSRLKVFELGSGDIDRFTQAAKSYGVLFTLIDDPGTNRADVVVREGDVQLVCRIFERIGYATPQGKEDVAKNANPRAPQGRKSAERGNGSKASAQRETIIERQPSVTPHKKAREDATPTAAAPRQTTIRDDVPQRTSVVSRVEAIKRAKAALGKETAAIAKDKTPAKAEPVR